ncbi:MAG: hypothetical protein JRG79_08290, partial [Deltaproteobacteria bacterium]|nr:hypothetical protein [Deltaproteobacteria bacterium]
LEYETLGMLGANCAIGDVDTIALLDRLCDDYGVDTIEIGGAMGVAWKPVCLNSATGRGPWKSCMKWPRERTSAESLEVVRQSQDASSV